MPDGVDPVAHRFVWDGIRAFENTRGVRHLCEQIHLGTGNPFWPWRDDPSPARSRAYRRFLASDALRVQTDILAGLHPAVTEVADALAVSWEASVSALVDTAGILAALEDPDGSGGTEAYTAPSHTPESSRSPHARFELPRGITVGQTCGREDQPVRNGIRYLVEGEETTQVGFGDLSFGHLYAIAATLKSDAAFIVLPETLLRKGLDEPLPPVNLKRLVEWAWYAIVDGRLYYVDPSGGNRLGYTWVRLGCRRTRTGRAIQTGRERVKVITPNDLANGLRQL